MKILAHVPGKLITAKFRQVHYNEDLILHIDRYMWVRCYVDTNDNQVRFNVAFIPYVKQMMEIFYND